MTFIISVLTILTVWIKVWFDNRNWGNVDHTKGIVLVALVLFPLCLISTSLYPIFLYGMLFNPTINFVRDLPLFYIGDTSKVDILLKEIFEENAGEAFFLINFICFLTFL